ncbi:hypothetical protein KAT36_00210 [Candidatus Pacearchaeota archaeon]|nr:hypothetical protein [Candidatus Pacearchaeota archaeon]
MAEKGYRAREQTKKPYEKPSYNIETTMTFMFDAIKNRDTKYTCRQCSSCHGCR